MPHSHTLNTTTRRFVVLLMLSQTFAGAGQLLAQPTSPDVAPEEVPAAASPSTGNSLDVPALIQIIDSQRGKLTPETLPSPETAKQKLQSAITALRSRLARSGTQRQSDWLRFLQFNLLEKELGSDNPDIQQLVQIEKNTRQNYPGLDMPQMVSFRNALVTYVDALRFGRDAEGTIRGLDQRLEALSKQLQDRGTSMSDLELQRDLALITNYLESANQATTFREQIASKYSRPTARVLISADFLSRAFGRPVYQTNPVNEVILGTTICGQSLMTGQVTPCLIENPNNATIQLNLQGQFSSNNVGHNRGVRLLTSSRAGVAACETIQMTDNGLTTLNNTSINTSFVSQINSIQHNMRLVRNIAQKKAAQQKPQADAIGKSRLERRISGQFHEQLSEQLATSNSRFSPTSTPVLTRLGIARPDRSSWSTTSQLGMLWNSDDANQLAAPTDCPLEASNSGLTAQIHQSMIANFLSPVLAGRIIRNRDLGNFARQFGAEVGEDLAKEESGENWSITLASHNPVEVEFVDNLVSFQIRTTRLDRGDQDKLVQPATIRANYRIELVDGAVQLYRQGDVEVQFTGRDQRGIRATTLRGFLKSKFDTAFKETLFKEPVRLADRLPVNAPAMSITSLVTGSGWLQATVN